MNAYRILLAAAAVVAFVTPAGAVSSLSENETLDCPPVCSAACLKPIVIPDRWDDVALLPGHEAWLRNGRFDQESFTDQSANGLYDVGEPFEDDNANGHFDQEAYHPFLTGYIPDPVPGNVLAPDGDLGRLVRLRPSKESRVVASSYFAVSFPPIGKGEPARGARAFRNALEWCVPYPIERGDWVELEPGSMTGPTYDALLAMYQRDPHARWDEATKEIVDSEYPSAQQPRLVLVALSDPRIGPESGRSRLQLVKIAAFFFEAPRPDGAVNGRFLKVRSPGYPCGCNCDQASSFLRECP